MATKKATLLLVLKEKVSRGLSRVGRRLRSMGDDIKAARLRLGILGIAIAAVGTALLKAAGDIEQWRISFTTMLGSAERADVLLNKIKKFAKETPFDLPQVVKGGRALLAFGIEADKIIPTMKSLGDVSAGLGVPMERLILNFGQVKAQAKLTGRELRDFAVAGVPLLATLAKNLNKTEAEIQDMVSRGTIGFRLVEKAFESMSGEGGRFSNLMAKQMDSLQGKFSNVKDVVFQLAAEFGNSLLPATKEVLDVLIKLGEALLKIVSAQEAGISINEIALEQIEREIEQRESLLRAAVNMQFFKTQNESIEDRNALRAMKRIRDNLKAQILKDAQEKKIQKERIKTRELEEKGILAAEKRISADIIVITKKRNEAISKQEEIRKQNFASTMSFIASLSTSTNKELAIIGKAGAIALAIINVARARTLALASAPPPFNFALAAAVAAAGALQIAKIAGVNLQKGGVILPRAGGTQATIGEAGSAEAVIPLDDDEATEKLSEAGIGGVTINVGVLVGGEDNIKELARMVDEELFDLRRNNQSVAFESL